MISGEYGNIKLTFNKAIPKDKEQKVKEYLDKVAKAIYDETQKDFNKLMSTGHLIKEYGGSLCSHDSMEMWGDENEL